MRGMGVGSALWLAGSLAAAEEIQLAVASNFYSTLQVLASVFESVSEHELTIVLGSTGKHYAQIRNGAPFDILLAADATHPRMLEDDGLAVNGSRFTYARGELVLWSPIEGFVDGQGQVIEKGDYRHLGMANPDLAPYGLAARQVLESLGQWEQLQDRLVRGENIGQAFQFVVSGNAELGFVALSQITTLGNQTLAGSIWRVPQDLYTPIDQQAVLLTDTGAARAFLDFLESEKARDIIRQSGYRAPRTTAHVE